MKKQLMVAALMSSAVVLSLPSLLQTKALDFNAEACARAGICQEMYMQQNVKCSIEGTNYVNTSTTIPWIDGFLSARCNIRQEPSENAEILDVYEFNSIVSFWDYGDPKWVKIKYYDEYAYVCKDFISLEECKFKTISIPDYSGFKSFMSYKAITSTNSKQYALEQIAYTGNYGIRMYNGYYLVAVGTGTGATVGNYIDLVLENGTVIHCIVGDIKADQDTNSSNLITTHSDCCSEFIVDMSAMNGDVLTSGDMSSCQEDWQSSVCEILVYEGNALDED